MKALSVVLLLMASMAFVVMGCSDNSASVVSPSDQTLSRTAELTATGFGKSGPLLNSVSGNVHTYIRFVTGTGKRKWDCFSNMSLSAKLGQDNTISGNIHSRYIGTPPPDYFPEFSGKIVQLKVEENPVVGRMAKVMFEVTDGVELFPPEFGPTPVGCFVVVDGGEGKNGLPDCISSLQAIDSYENMHAWGFYDLSPGDYIQGIIPILPYYNLDSPYHPVDNGNIQVR